MVSDQDLHCLHTGIFIKNKMNESEKVHQTPLISEMDLSSWRIPLVKYVLMCKSPPTIQTFEKPVFVNIFLSIFQEVMLGFHTDRDNTPASIFTSFPSIVRLDILPGRMEDLALSKRLLAACLSALKTNGSKGVHVELNIGDKYMMEHYRLLGFIQVPNTDSEDTMYFARLL